MDAMKEIDISCIRSAITDSHIVVVIDLKFFFSVPLIWYRGISFSIGSERKKKNYKNCLWMKFKYSETLDNFDL